MIEGKKLNLGGTEFVVPPFPMRILRTHPEWLKSVRELSDIPTPEQSEAILGIIHAALARNYPDLTPEGVEDLLDVASMMAALQAVMDVSGMVPVAPGSPGEATPGS